MCFSEILSTTQILAQRPLLCPVLCKYFRHRVRAGDLFRRPPLPFLLKSVCTPWQWKRSGIWCRTKIRGKNEKHKKEHLGDKEEEEEEEEGVKTKERFEGITQDTHRGGLSKARL